MAAIGAYLGSRWLQNSIGKVDYLGNLAGGEQQESFLAMLVK